MPFRLTLEDFGERADGLESCLRFIGLRPKRPGVAPAFPPCAQGSVWGVEQDGTAQGGAIFRSR